MITIVGLGVRQGDLTLGAVEALKGGDPVYVRTLRHPAVEALAGMGLSVQSMDDLYEQCESFDELNSAITRRLAEAGGNAVYATPGSAALNDTQVACITALCRSRGISCTILPGVGWEAVAAAEYGGAESIVAASAADARLPGFLIDPRKTLIITELDTSFIAGEMKLRLMRHYPDTHIVHLGDMELPLHEIDRQSYSVDTVLLVPPIELHQAERMDFYHLMEIVSILRDPVRGCPWDRQLTHESLLKYLIEEAYEVQDAVRQGDADSIADELGDVLLQVALHSQIGQEYGEFDSMDVTSAICRKMISRHPHIFASEDWGTAEEVSRNWAAIKRVEKGLFSLADELDEVPRSFPALLRAEKMLKRADGVIPDMVIGQEIAAGLLALAEQARRENLCAEQILAEHLDEWVRQERQNSE